ncbi:MAG: FKBP-type peptidyl-prolyl cis-trans isomerase [Bacteroidales bacterium]|nr:FKBP-type peptidyl-prolyl cis-trans isomerase [Bacteroidales bacterium]
MKLRYIIMAASLLALVSCAKEKTAGKNDDAKRYFDAWISQNYPAATKTPLGAYILSETPGTGILPEDSIYVRINYSCYTLDGTLQSTTNEKLARKCGLYTNTDYYGPLVAYRGEKQESLSAGTEEAISTMRMGGRKTVVIPGWLSETKRYNSAEKYVENCSGTDYIYEFEVIECFNDVDRWERDSLLRYLAANYPAAKEDTTCQGLFYLKTRDGLDKEFASDTTVYFNYTGRLLNGKVFDTTIADTAKVWGLYSSSKTYQQTKINWCSDSKDFTSITMGDSENSTVTGFARGLSLMHPGEAGICFFISKYGYKGSGSGSTIIGYTPLCFELDNTEAPN